MPLYDSARHIFNSTLALKAVRDKNGTNLSVWPAYLQCTATLRRQINRIRWFFSQTILPKQLTLQTRWDLELYLAKQKPKAITGRKASGRHRTSSLGLLNLLEEWNSDITTLHYLLHSRSQQRLEIWALLSHQRSFSQQRGKKHNLNLTIACSSHSLKHVHT